MGSYGAQPIERVLCKLAKDLRDAMPSVTGLRSLDVELNTLASCFAVGVLSVHKV